MKLQSLPVDKYKKYIEDCASELTSNRSSCLEVVLMFNIPLHSWPKPNCLNISIHSNPDKQKIKKYIGLHFPTSTEIKNISCINYSMPMA